MRKKILILTSTGGRGHMSAAEALQGYLSTDYDIVIAQAFKDVFKLQNITRYILPANKDGEDLYNWFLNNRWIRSLHFYYDAASVLFTTRHTKFTNDMVNYLKEQNPDLVISVIPIINGVTLAACEKLSIPFMVVPTDLDVTSFIVGIKNPTYQKFLFTRSFDEPLSLQTLAPAGIDPAQTPLVGFPIRDSFFHKHEVAPLKKKWDIPEKKPTILLMMGGQGALNIIDYARALAQVTIPIHLIICTGKNKHVQEQLNLIVYPSHISATIISFTSNIDQLMAIADVIITKSGSVSFNEALWADKPLFLDATAKIVRWEGINHSMLKSHDFGEIITDLEQLPGAITRLLTTPLLYNHYKANIAEFPKIRADKAIPEAVQKILTTP